MDVFVRSQQVYDPDKVKLCTNKTRSFNLKCEKHCFRVLRVVCTACTHVLLLPLQSETQTVGAAFYLVLGLQVVHALCGNAINGQNDVSHAHVGSDGLAFIGQLQIHTQTRK